MTRTYKNHSIDKNMNGKWIVTTPKGQHSQHATLADAKEWISNIIAADQFEANE